MLEKKIDHENIFNKKTNISPNQFEYIDSQRYKSLTAHFLGHDIIPNGDNARYKLIREKYNTA